ncbi:hypothetical protein THRCLA_22216 [Thraustotheca clavata]|uniref:Palmitoyltransferase n=1 Tax=Thraustotheca clavata TaxID=74557 RepID=A0A1V9Z9R5_9STRA|nr:hypothetical protein THRCLA_22216 [Thraustotheca clavata]
MEFMTLETPKEAVDASTVSEITSYEPKHTRCCVSFGQTHYLYQKRRTNVAFPFVLHVGPNWRCMVFTFLVILAPSLIFLLKYRSVSWISIVLVIMIILTFVSFSMVACSDPGIIREDYVNPQGIEEGVLCAHCRIRRPPNAVHCYECDVCIDGLDHHCPWTGKCIGKRTIWWFYLFLWMITLHLTFSVSVLVYYIIGF